MRIEGEGAPGLQQAAVIVQAAALYRKLTCGRKHALQIIDRLRTGIHRDVPARDLALLVVQPALAGQAKGAVGGRQQFSLRVSDLHGLHRQRAIAGHTAAAVIQCARHRDCHRAVAALRQATGTVGERSHIDRDLSGLGAGVVQRQRIRA